MIIFLHDNLGYKILKYIKKEDSSSINKIILVNNNQSKLNLFAKKFFSKKIIYWESSNKNKLIYKLKNTKTDIVLSITGVAGPDGGTKNTPVGTVFFTLGSRNKQKISYKTFHKRFKNTGRRNIQQKSALFAINQILKIIS